MSEATLVTIDISKLNKYPIPRPAMLMMGRQQSADHVGQTYRRNAKHTQQQTSTPAHIAPRVYRFLAHQLVPWGHAISKKRLADPSTNHHVILYGFARACGAVWAKGRTRGPLRPLLGCGGGFAAWLRRRLGRSAAFFSALLAFRGSAVIAGAARPLRVR